MKIVLRNLTKRFPNRNKKEGGFVTAVNNFDFEIPDGKLVGLLGPSGCGKSTALNLISGLEKPTEGKIFFGEDDVTGLPPEKRGVGLVFQNYALYPHLTVRQNILFPLQNLRGTERPSKEKMEELALEAARMVQIEAYMERRPSELSGGQQQRVAIARALVKRPRVLLLDEPLSNLDARLRLQTREEIRRIQRETGITTIFVTHDQEEAMSICDLIVVMKDGMEQQIGAPQEVYDRPVNLFVAKFLGTPAVSVFEGEVREEKLYIGGNIPVLDVPGVADRPVTAAIRPEGFVPDTVGTLFCVLNRIEIMGRDTSVIATNSHCLNELNTLRAIVDTEEIDEGRMPGSNIISFRLKPNKTHLFDPVTEERIPFGAVPAAAKKTAVPAAAKKTTAPHLPDPVTEERIPFGKELSEKKKSVKHHEG